MSTEQEIPPNDPTEAPSAAALARAMVDALNKYLKEKEQREIEQALLVHGVTFSS